MRGSGRGQRRNLLPFRTQFLFTGVWAARQRLWRMRIPGLFPSGLPAFSLLTFAVIIIVELGRLEKGVAAITQSDWLEPVLCKVDKYEGSGWSEPKTSPSTYDPQDNPTEDTLLDFIMSKEIYRRGDRVDTQRLWERIVQSRLDTAVKCDFIEYINAEGEKAVESLRTLVYDFFQAERAIHAAKECKSIEEWSSRVVELLDSSLKGYTQQQINIVLALIVYEQAERDISYRELFCRFTEVYWAKGGVV